jgi:flagellar hook-length control protein FliK
MSIERTGSPVSPKVSPGAQSSSSKGKVTPDDASDGSAGAGFLALLTSLAPQAVAADSGESSLAQAPSTESLLLAIAPGADQSENLAMLMAQAGEVAGDINGQNVASSQVLGGPQAPTTAGDLLTPVAARSSFMHIASSTAPDKSAIAVDVLDAGKSAISVQADVAATALLERTQQAMAARVIQNPGTSHLQSAAAATAADSRSASLATMFQDLASIPTLASAAAASGWSEGLTRPSDRPGSKLAGLQSALGIEGAGGGHMFQAGSQADLPSAMVNPSTPTFESAVAEKLNYWIAQGVQNAELELEGLGDEPVAVRISLKGDEAHIGFRTDQPEIRRLLEGASAQLKDLLASEGLLLSQVSVGTSGQDGSGQQERRPPTGTRTGVIKAPETAPVQGARRPGVSVGAAVDLFV